MARYAILLCGRPHLSPSSHLSFHFGRELTSYIMAFRPAIECLLKRIQSVMPPHDNGPALWLKHVQGFLHLRGLEQSHDEICQRMKAFERLRDHLHTVLLFEVLREVRLGRGPSDGSGAPPESPSPTPPAHYSAADWNRAVRLSDAQAREGRRALIKLIQDAPNVPDRLGPDGRDQHLAIIEMMLCAGTIDPNFLSPEAGAYPIHLAARQGDVLLVELLLRYGARVAVHDQRGDTPLHIANRSNNRPVVDALLATGVPCAEPSPADRANALDAFGRPALWYASGLGPPSGGVLDRLLTLGRDVVNRRCKNTAANPSSDELPTALWAAASQGRLDAARALLRARGGSTLLHKANWPSMGGGRQGARRSGQRRVRVRRGQTVLMRAEAALKASERNNGLREVVRWLVELGAGAEQDS
ncbi:hypothetical protein VTJ83DRAFT_1850 [Remersonia thermophila]|uniref:Uncharacterized protein n=1 Tax=Remersonia thermophila TaxID=72144 RepID=A0ABR4DHB4_9PEZI